VVVDHADCLHVRVDHRRAHEAEAAALEILAERVGFARGGRNLPMRPPAIHSRLAADELPAVGVEAAELVPHGEERAGVFHRGLDLLAITDDRRVDEQLVDPLRVVSRHLLRIEVAERAAIPLALAEHDRPAQSGLGRFEHEEFEVLPIVVCRNAPLAVVVFDHQRILAGPRASCLVHGSTLHFF
jgi:hypothetical protein